MGGPAPSAPAPLLDVQDLTVAFPARRGQVQAVRGMSFSVAGAEILALVGESGCGKSLAALSVMGLLPGALIAGRVILEGEDLLTASTARLRALRGGRMAMIFQNPRAALNPVLTIGRQISESLEQHTAIAAAEVRAAGVSLLREVGVAQPEQRFDSYPHELSGGMCQRVVIAMALAGNPVLLIADEPTTALDVTVQAQIMALLHDLRRQRGAAIVLITHDLGLVAAHADRAAVAYAGRIVEIGPVARLMGAPAHPYTAALLAAMPDRSAEKGRLQAIPGSAPPPSSTETGCAFAPRCTFADERCRAVAPPDLPVAQAGSVRCWKPLLEPAP